MNIDPLLALDIISVLGKYIKLQKRGADYKACCPFHNEKTPSFSVSTSKQIYKCFGCGKGGNLISFVMEHESLPFIDAVKLIAKDHHVQLDFKEKTPEDKQNDNKKESLYQVNQLAAEYFKEQLFTNESPLPLEYAKSRFNNESIENFDIGFASGGWHGLIAWMKKKGVKEQLLLDAGLIREKNTKRFDFFLNRLIFPIHNKYGRITGFSGRNTSNDKKISKYSNSPKTIIYNKSEALYGLHLAHRFIRNEAKAILVEGSTDVIRMHQIGVHHTVGSCGTSLTIGQIRIIKKLCNSITLLFDGDTAGDKRTRVCTLINKEGMYCNVITLPYKKNNKGKVIINEDPDTFFKNKSRDDYDQYAGENIIDFIFYYANSLKNKAKAPDKKALLIDELAYMIINLPESSHDLYVEEVGKIITPKKALNDKIKSLKKDQNKEEKTHKIPNDVKLSDFDKYGFYDSDNKYFFNTGKGIHEGSNFVLEPLFHIESVMAAKRLFRITNVNKYTKLVEFDQADLISLARFQLKTESIGNFIWKAGLNELIKLKSFLYEETLTAKLVEQLGWNKAGFFCWSNGIYNDKFNAISDMGIVKHKEQNYYIPAFSGFYKGEDNLFMSEKKFIHNNKVNTKVTLKEYTQRLANVFGENAKFAFCYLLACLNRDIIVSEFGFFPMLNLFGFKGSGKTELGESILHFFGAEQKGINLPNSTEPAIADYISQTRNAVALLDEYKNDFEPSKIEFLKGLWKAIGRTRMNMDKDKKKETTSVDTGVIICGQHMPTADIALFHRLIYLTFKKTEYTDKEKEMFNELKNIEKSGLTYLTHEILSHREHFKANYLDHYNKCAIDLGDALKGEIIEDRIFRNWLVAIASFSVLKEKIDTDYNYIDLIKIATQQILLQNKETKSSNEISTFWRIVQYLDADGLIKEGVDYKIKHKGIIKTDIMERMFKEGLAILYIQQSRVIPLYKKHGKQMGENILPSDSIDYYLRNDSRYLGKKMSVRFKLLDKAGVPITDKEGKPKDKITTAYCFEYNKLGISLEMGDPDENPEDELPY